MGEQSRERGEGARGRERADRLGRVLDEVQRLCAELDLMSRRQSAELDAGRPEEAAAVVLERSRLVSRLGDAARELGGDAPSFERVIAGVPVEMATRAREQAAAIASIVGEVLARDAEDREMLAAERDRLTKELAGLGRGRSAVAAYGGSAAPGATMQDRKG